MFIICNKHSWGFLGWATTWGNGRVSQSFWVLENNSVVLKSLFCGIVWCEIQSYRKATCNFVVLTFIKKNLLHQGSNQGPSDQKPDALPDELLRLCWKRNEFLKFLYLKLQICSTGMVLDLKIGGGGGQSAGDNLPPGWNRVNLSAKMHGPKSFFYSLHLCTIFTIKHDF